MGGGATDGISLALPDLPAVTYEGNLKEITGQLIILELDDWRLFNFKRAGSTRFYKESKQVQAANLRPGDRVSVEARLDDHAFLVAGKVTFQVITPEQAAALAARVRPDPSAAELSDTGAGPVLKRTVARPELKRRVSDERGSVSAGGVERPPMLQTPAMLPTDDPLIAKAADAAFTFSDALPNFLCEEHMGRFTRDPRATGWKPLDTVSADVIYENGQESYRNLKIDGRPTEKRMEQLSGSWSTGEFATTLRNLFHPASAATFRFAENSRLLGLPARVYDFEVKQENSHWNLQMDFQRITPGYTGSVWIELESGRVLRMEMQAAGLPEDFPMDQVESAVDYAFIAIGAENILLPVHAENLGCQRVASVCSRTVIDFRNYRNYISDSTIRFDP